MSKSEIYSTLEQVFGFSSLRSGQEEVITQILAGQSSLAVFPTGAGKSLCYQLPALMLEGMTLVVSPLIALMKDQVESLTAKGVSARKLDSSLSTEEVMETYDLMRSGRLKILFVAPERFSNPSFINRLQSVKIDLLAVDEAHCISEWGHSFRPDYLKIAQGAERLQIPLRLALTATATPKVSEDICQSFGITPEHHVQTGFKRPNLSLNIVPVTEEERDSQLIEMVSKHREEPTIIYVTRQMTTEHITTFLNKRDGIMSRSYHAGMSAERRNEIQEEFMEGRCNIIVATIAFGMGIDKADIRHVYHYNLPKSFENYVQETGRAGRDGLPSQCYMLACKADLGVLENFVYGKHPSLSAIESLVSATIDREGEVALDRYNLSVAFDIKAEVIQTVLVWLELGGYVESRGWRHGKYDVTFLRSKKAMLAGHSPEQQQFLISIFSSARKSPRNPNRYNFEVAAIAEKLGEQEGKIAKSLQWLETHGDIALKPSQYLMLYQAKEKGLAASSKAITQELDEHFTHWEQQELLRLQSIIDLAESDGCIESQVLAYFGELSEPCGKCSSCCSGSGVTLAEEAKKELGQGDLQLIHEVVAEQHTALHSARQLTRFLCGMTSPATTRARLTTKHDRFGVFQDYHFTDVLLNCQVVLGE